MDFVELCKKIIRINSSPSAGNVEVAKFCASLCKDSGLFVTLQSGEMGGKEQINLIARPQLETPNEEIVFQTHLDTVEGGNHGHWTKTGCNPFAATIDGDTIYGLGTADVKLDFLCKLEVLKHFAKQKMRVPFVLVGTFGEEVGMIGAKALMESKMLKAKKAIIGEPSEMQIVYANNGYLVIELQIPYTSEELKTVSDKDGNPGMTQEKIFVGKAAHSSTPHLGENAILKMVDYLSKMPDGIAIVDIKGGNSMNTVPADASVEFDSSHGISDPVNVKLIKVIRFIQKLDREFLGFSNADFSPPHPTANIATLKREQDHLSLGISFRVTPNIDSKTVSEWLERIGAEVKTVGGTSKVIRNSPAAWTSPDSELVKGAIDLAKKVGTPDKIITKASGTECSIYTKYGVDCIVIGPGKSVGNSHTANEHNSFKQLELAKKFYQEAAKRFCI